MNKPVILLGSGGHARVLLGMLQRCNIDIAGVTDPARSIDEEWLGCKILGDDSAVAAFTPECVALVNGIGSLPRDSGLRSKLYKSFVAQGYHFQTLIDPRAFIASDAVSASGVQVMAGVIIQTGAQIAENCIINSGAIIEHDCRIGRHAHVAPGAVLCGGVEVGDDAHIGAGAVVIQGIHIGSGSVIGAGSVVTRNVGNRQIVYPARPHIQDL